MNSLAGNVRLKPKYAGSPILNSIDPNINNDTRTQTADHEPICSISDDLQSLNLLEDEHEDSNSVLLLDDSENLLVNSEESFLAALKIPPNEKVKVVSIFGNTGEGKSYTLNELFFNGEQVFRTSQSQTSCTLGVWARYNPTLKLICLDTEGALGISKKENQRTRLHLKVLAVSDIVIYRTRAERLHRDMYTFLGDASKAYTDHFSAALKKALSKSDAERFSNPIGPGIVIFHETRLTDTLQESAGLAQSAEDILQSTFADLKLPLDAFSFLKYVGVRTVGSRKTSFTELRAVLHNKLESNEVRTRRDAKYVYLTLKSLNEKFNNVLTNATPQMFLPAFFTCPEKCLSCKSSCDMSVGHKDEGEPHQSKSMCSYQHQYQNKVYLCKACHRNGIRNVVTKNCQGTDESWAGYLNYVWSGYVIECSRCGEIYRSRQHWYGNDDPEDKAVLIEMVHVWSGDKRVSQEKSLFGSQNSAQKVLDGVSSVTGVIASVTSQPSRLISHWAADSIAPSYWRPNSEIRECYKCNRPFGDNDSRHHCRACGEGFCDGCSSKRQPVPSRGWQDDVRVCDDCYREEPPSVVDTPEGNEITARQMGETFVNTLSVVKSVINIPTSFIKDTARPTYWTPDSECSKCAVCETSFGILTSLHHCRDCGLGVCDDCSLSRKPVPLRGWDGPVRVCNNCR